VDLPEIKELDQVVLMIVNVHPEFVHVQKPVLFVQIIQVHVHQVVMGMLHVVISPVIL